MQGSISFDGGLNGSIVSSGSLSGSIDTSGSGSTVTIQPTLFEGQKIADYTIDGIEGELYAPEGSGGSSVDIDPVLAAGVKIADFSIDGVEGEIYAPEAENVSITPTYQSGVKVADYSIGSNNGSIYIPGSIPPGFDNWISETIMVEDHNFPYPTQSYITDTITLNKSNSLNGKRCLIRGCTLYNENNTIYPVTASIVAENETSLSIQICVCNNGDRIDTCDLRFNVIGI